MSLVLPKALQLGDTLAIISPAGPSSAEAMAQGVAYVQSIGFQVKVMPHALAQSPYTAGTDTQRLADLHTAFADPNVQGILCARGGYGTMRLLSQIDWDLIRQNPKVFIGFSDLTSFLLPLYERTGLVGFHGPMLTSNLIENDAYTQAELWKQVMGSVPYPYPIPNQTAYQCIHPGTAEGPLIGGNLSLLAAICGTPYQPETKGHLLFLEDWHEAYYTLDRKLTQLKLAGLFDDVAGVVLCDFVELSEDRPDYSLAQFFTDWFAFLQVPVGLGYSVGHGVHSATIPVGCPARFEATSGRFEILSAPVSQP